MGGSVKAQPGVADGTIMEHDEPLDSMPMGGCHRLLLIDDRDSDVVAFHRAVRDRRLPVALHQARNATEALAMLQLESGRSDDLLILLNLDLLDGGAEKFLMDLRGHEQVAERIVVGYTAELPPAGEQVAMTYGLVSCLYPTVEGEQRSTAILIQFVDSFLQIRV